MYIIRKKITLRNNSRYKFSCSSLILVDWSNKLISWSN